MAIGVSVIIPMYNAGNTIIGCLDSILDQTYTDFEIIIVDDGSTDSSYEIVKDYINKNNIQNLTLLKQDNQGPSIARNKGWDIATQPYIAFLDADDTWHPEKIAIQLKYMIEHSDVVITGHGVRWLRSVDINITSLPTNYTVKPISRFQMLLSNCLATRSVMLKREIDFRFEPTKRFSEDYLLWLSIILSGNKAAFIDLELAYTYKAPYGEGGLSGDLWNMEKGELDVFNRLRKSNKISMLEWLILNLYSLLKFLLRWIKCNIRFNTVM